MSFFRLVPSSLLCLTLVSQLVAQSAAPAEKSNNAELESKLSTVLRSYSLLDAEVEKLKAANAQLGAEKAALEVKLAEAQAAVPMAVQTVALRDQLRQTQAQMAAYAEENVQLKTKLALLPTEAPRSGSSAVAPSAATPAPIQAAASTPAPAPAKRTHVIVEGDTLVKISQKYYGTPNRWNEILVANRDVLRDEKSLVIGRTLTLP